MFYMTPSRLHHELDRLWNIDPFVKHTHSGEKQPFTYDGPSIDVEETPDAFMVRAEMPGLEKDQFSVTYEDDHLVIRGEKKQKRECKEGNVQWMECSYGSFERTVHFPSPVESNQVQAKYQNGVLEVRLNKNEASKLKEIPIKFN